MRNILEEYGRKFFLVIAFFYMIIGGVPLILKSYQTVFVIWFGAVMLLGLVIDHLSIMVSGIEGGDERRLIDNIMTKLRSLARRT